MADEATVPEFDDNGQPIIAPPENEGGDQTPKTEIESTKEPVVEEDPTVPVRSSAQHIIARKNRQIEKLRSRQEDDGEDLSQDGDDAPVTRADLKPIIETIAGSADENELKNLFDTTPEAKQYEKSIKLYMDHPAWKAVPVSAIYHHLAFSAAQKAGANKKNAAELEASQMKGGGTSHRPSETRVGNMPTAEEINNMSDAEIEALGDKVRTGRL